MQGKTSGLLELFRSTGKRSKQMAEVGIEVEGTVSQAAFVAKDYFPAPS